MTYTERIEVRVTPEEKALVKKAAHRNEQTVAEFVREMLLAATKRNGPAEPSVTIEVPVQAIGEAALIAAPRKHKSEPWSLVCPNRNNHQAGVYCPECKGDGALR